MGPEYFGCGGMWGFPMSIIVSILVAVFLFVGWLLFGGPWRRSPGAYDDKDRKTEKPLQILERRYAKGEITKQEFEQIKKDLSL
jgi:putative membrane protein